MVEGINGTTKVQTPVNVNNTKQKDYRIVNWNTCCREYDGRMWKRRYNY